MLIVVVVVSPGLNLQPATSIAFALVVGGPKNLCANECAYDDACYLCEQANVG